MNTTTVRSKAPSLRRLQLALLALAAGTLMSACAPVLVGGAMLGGALVVMAGVYNFAKWVDKPATQPFADKTFPFDGLKAELGRE